MTPPGRRRALLLGSLGALALGVGALSYAGIEKNLVYYLSPDELLAQGAQAHGATVRLGGLVQSHSVVWDAKSMQLAFDVGLADAGGPHVHVQATGAPPQMFQEGIGAVVEGAYDGQIFRAERVMVKHSNEYRPPAPGEAAHDLYGTLEAPLQGTAVAPVSPANPAPSDGTPTRYE